MEKRVVRTIRGTKKTATSRSTKKTAKSRSTKKTAKSRGTKKTATKGSRKSRSVSLPSLFPEYRKEEYAARVSKENEKFRSELREAYFHKGLVLYIGAGVSRSVGLPNWPELIRSLTVTMMTQKVKSAIEAVGDIRDEKYWDIIHKIQEDVENTADYEKPILMMARAIKDVMGDNLPHAIARTLYRMKFRMWVVAKGKQDMAPFLSKQNMAQFRLSKRTLPSSKLLDELVSLSRAERDIRGVQAIVNYNYDDVFDEKLREQNVRCKTVRSGRDRIPTGTLPCYHVHGVLPLQMLYKWGKKLNYGNFVFSEDEYHTEYSDPY